MIPQKQIPREIVNSYFTGLEKSGIKSLIETYMPEPGSNRGYRAWQYILPVLLMLQAGGRHVEDLRQMRDDVGLREVIGLKKMPSLSTYGDWFRRMGRSKGLKCLKGIITKTVKKFLKAMPVDELTLWSDPTIMETDKAEAKMTYKGQKGYRPILTAFKEVPVIIWHKFREGNAHDGQLEAIKAAFELVPKGKKIVHLSLDSEYYKANVINYAEEKGVTFSIVAVQDKAVKEAIEGIKEWRTYRDRDGNKTDREIGETVHTMDKTKKGRPEMPQFFGKI